MRIEQLVGELERQLPLKYDSRIKAGKVGMIYHQDRGRLALVLNEKPNFTRIFQDITDGCHQQISDKLEIPMEYYRKMMAEEPNLLVENVQTWLDRKPDRELFVRTFMSNGGIARAFLSGEYRVIDNHDVLMCVLNELQAHKTEIEECHLSDTMMFVKVKSPQLRDFVKEVGDDIVGGLLLGNSETGHAAVKVQPRIFRVRCTNGMVLEQLTTRQIHLGGGDDELFDDQVYLQIRRSIRETFDRFGEVVARLRDTTEMTVKDPIGVINNVVRQYRLTQEQKEHILVAFGVEQDATRYGVANSITRAAQVEPTYERVIDMERLGGRLIEMPDNEFNRLQQVDLN